MACSLRLGLGYGGNRNKGEYESAMCFQTGARIEEAMRG